ncbi:C-type lectin Cal-like isoform X2 [Stegostoma tigrinum]|nr:C-type lectin Cal-like isoform X2 [Stegostoma tigrinum]XP_059510769.1 C-type lectin Cal-like isoform X2 [Stegostoma tigrinum]XP_059510770.1 C-type lectin Cal-like isoform X2 [Stegostoma tigrinum]
MKLIGVLLLSGLYVSNVAADHVQNSTDLDQDIEKRDLTSKGDCPGGITYFGSCYKFVSEKKTWIDAEMHCRDLAPGGHLASVHWVDQYILLAEMIHQSQNGYPPTWIGSNDVHKEGTFLWSDGSTGDFLLWAKGEPNDYNAREDCVHTFKNPTINWNDLPYQSKLSFLCSYKLPSPYSH